jgi:phosphate-selective porin OprO/OprP
MILRLTGWLVILALIAVPCRAQTGLKAYYNDDFILETEDGAFQLRIRGNIHFDARFFQSDERGAPHSLDIRRARIDLMGRIHRRFTFRLQPELSGTPYIRNAWVDAEIAPALHVQLGQMKVPFSTSWLTLDNNLNFIERGAAEPAYPFFDRGVLVWGELSAGALVYSLGVYNGAGTELELPPGDRDDHKELAGRLFLQPFQRSASSLLRGLYAVIGGTWGNMSQPTLLETKAYRSPNLDTYVWRWRTEQLIGTDGRVTDRVAAQIDSRRRIGAELHYLLGPFALSSEYLETHFHDIVLYHDFYVGSARSVHEELRRSSGTIRSWSTWASVYLTGESKRVTDAGWRTARPKTFVGENGPGAVELLARYSRTWTGQGLFESVGVSGFAAGSPSLPPGYRGTTPGAGNRVTAAVADGAHAVHEITLGVNWSLNPMVRLQLNDVFMWTPAGDRDGDGQDDNLLVSGAASGQGDPDRKNVRTDWENAVLVRLIFKF